jgi:hypothetical protein
LTYVLGPQTDLPPNSDAITLTATCPAGTKVVGGGGAPFIALQGASIASDNNGSGWSLIVINTTGVDIPNAFAFAVCAGS